MSHWSQGNRYNTGESGIQARVVQTEVKAQDDPVRFQAIVGSLLSGGDRYPLLADYASYVECQERVARTYQSESVR